MTQELSDPQEAAVGAGRDLPSQPGAGPGSSTLDFAGLSIAWDRRLLQPRPWTELQARWAAELLAAEETGGPVLELCAGAGHIGLGAAALSGRSIVCVDVDPVATEQTVVNARANAMADRVEARCGRLQDVLRPGEVFALVIADPPWVPHDEVGRFPEDPTLAIDGGDDGLDLARACVTASLGHLACGGSLLLQLGDADQATRVAGWAAGSGWMPAGRREGDGGIVLRLLHP